MRSWKTPNTSHTPSSPAEFERAMIRERVLAGIAGAHDQGTQLGRRRLEDTDAKKVVAIRRARKKKGWHPPGARVPAR